MKRASIAQFPLQVSALFESVQAGPMGNEVTIIYALPRISSYWHVISPSPCAVMDSETHLMRASLSTWNVVASWLRVTFGIGASGALVL